MRECVRAVMYNELHGHPVEFDPVAGIICGNYRAKA
jgi:hypothetical protein